MSIAPSAATPQGADKFVILMDQIGQNAPAFIIENNGSCRNRDHHGLSIPPGALAAFTMAAVLGPEVLPVVKIVQSCSGVCRSENNRPSVPAVPTIRAAAGNEFLTPEAETAMATIAGVDLDSGPVKKHRPLAR